MGDDPGSDFSRLVRQSGQVADIGTGDVLDLPHGTTCIAMRYDEGVLIAGDRRATSGNLIQLSAMLRQNLPMARQGMVVVPLFAGYDLRTEVGRLFQFDVSGGRYEELEYGATGSGSLHASTALKIGYRKGQDREAAIKLAIEALYIAADEDSATGGPDFIRNLFPIVATVTANGYEQLDDDEVRGYSQVLVDELTARNQA